jgi:anthranilate synthase/aminodeoxychorismate synthase-like glutamine amidotransferase
VRWLEPLEAYRRLRAAGHAPLLLDGMGAHPEARRAYLALTPHVEVRITGHGIEERWADGALEVATEDPVAYLRRLTGRFRFDIPEPEGFTGGWVGVFGFAFARNLEPTLPSGPAAATPDVVLRLCLDALVFDRAARTVRLHCADLEGDTGTVRSRAGRILADLARPASPPPSPPPPAAPVAWQASLGESGFQSAVDRLKAHIREGDLFQANLATRFRAPLQRDGADLFAALAAANPSPFMALLDFGDHTVVSGSPEQLFWVQDGRIRSRPIAGTRKRGATPAQDAAMERELLEDPKELAEHTMLVDLMRNDVARVAQPGTVQVPQRMGVERYRHVMHLVSRVEARLRPETTFMDWMAALFPGGTVTGAPKVRATQRIVEVEPVARGAYTGSAGYLSWSHNAHWNILIRTLVLQDGFAEVHAGSGIVADSAPQREWKEAGRKAQALLDAATGSTPAGGPARLGDVSLHGSWSPPRAAARHGGKRVLLVDNYDSFVHNLADYAAALGAQATVIRNDTDWRAAAETFRPTHVILSPGPGWPREAGCTMDVARELTGRVPILGVCLGHQAIAQAFGATVKVHPNGPVHGKTDAIHHTGKGLFAGLPSPLTATRYHSLIVEGLGPEWTVDARLADGTVMALRHRGHPTFGLQFHPESIGTEQGMDLLDRFLATC